MIIADYYSLAGIGRSSFGRQDHVIGLPPTSMGTMLSTDSNGGLRWTVSCCIENDCLTCQDMQHLQRLFTPLIGQTL